MSSNDPFSIDIKQFVKQGFIYKVAEGLTNYFFQPIIGFFERLSAKSTAKFCEDRIPARERIK